MYGCAPYTAIMATTHLPKTSRLEMRLTEEQRARIEHAAALRGTNITQWAVENLLNDANRDITEESIIRLSDRAYDSFVNALNDPMPEPLLQLLKEEPIWND